jgi:hypothetical protein
MMGAPLEPDTSSRDSGGGRSEDGFADDRVGAAPKP